MKEIVITNLRLVADGLSNNAEAEAMQLLAAVNAAFEKFDSQPILLIDGDRLQAEYRDGEEDDG